MRLRIIIRRGRRRPAETPPRTLLGLGRPSAQPPAASPSVLPTVKEVHDRLVAQSRPAPVIPGSAPDWDQPTAILDEESMVAPDLRRQDTVVLPGAPPEPARAPAEFPLLRPPVVGYPPEEESPAATPAPRRPWLVAGIAAVVLGLVGWVFYDRTSSEGVAAGRLTESRRLTPEGGLAMDPVIDPQGRLVAYASDRGGDTLSIWVDHLDGSQPARLTRSEAHDSEPDIDPSGQHVAFRSEREGGGIYVVSLLSSDPPRLLVKEGRRPRYSPDGKWVAYYDKNGATAANSGARLFVIPAEGGTPRQIRADFPVAQMPVWTPDGKHLLFDGTSPAGVTDWWVTPVENGPPVATGVLRLLQQAFWSIAGPDQVLGTQVFFSGSAGDERHVWAVRLSPATWKVAGDPEMITAGGAQFGQLRAGGQTAAYANSRTTIDVWVAEIQGDEGRVQGELRRVSKAANYSHLPSVDQQGTHLVYLSNRSGVEDLWMSDLTGDTETPVTTDLRIAYRPVLSADGSRLILSTVEGKKCSVVVAEIVERREELALEGCAGIWDWSPDRQHVLFFDPDGVGARAAHLMQIPTGRRSEIIWHPKLGIFHARFSPDGKWIAFTAGPTIGTAKVFIAPFRQAVVAPEQWIPISDTEGSSPAWSPNGRLVYYRSRRDGFDCIWARRLDGAQRPAGEPIPIIHFHSPAKGLYQLPESSFMMTVTPRHLVLSLARHSGEVWVGKFSQ